MAITRVIATLPYFSAVPEDVASNVFYYSTVAEMITADVTAVVAKLDAFYAAVDGLLSPVIATTGGTYRFYRMSDPEPRSPFETVNMPTLSLGAAGTAEEVAICLSYHAVAVSGEPAGRRRGRIYLGPLASSSIQNGTSSTFSNVGSATRTTIANAGAALADQSDAQQWCVYSPTDNVARQIVGGWVDNSFDTQRRRGRRANARTLWTGQP